MLSFFGTFLYPHLRQLSSHDISVGHWFESYLLIGQREFLITFKNEPISHYLSVPFPTYLCPMVIFPCTDLATLIKRNKCMIPENAATAAIEIFKTGVTVTNQFIPMINFFFQDATVGCTVKKV